MTLLAAVIAIALPHAAPAVAKAAKADDGCQTPACDRRVQRKHWRQTVRPYRAWLLTTARCESGLRWQIHNPPYSGGLQFTSSSWRAVGGAGIAANASRLEQMYRAVLLLRLQGRGAWPVCG